MNQNILIGLERQAEKLVLQIPAALDSNEYTSLFNEKFAELILKECFQYIDNEEDRLWNLSLKEGNPNYQSNFEICADKCRDILQGLKEHFGVGE